MPESLAANEKRVIAKAGQVFILPGFTVRAEQDGPIVFGCRSGGVPWIDSAKLAEAFAVTSRQRTPKP